MVDGIVVIPGTFTAFRRGPAVTAGGFPVGMNGEDSDLTMQIGGLGYRVVVDPRIRSYEDCRAARGNSSSSGPAGPGRFPRLRPARPAAGGLAGPRVWFWTLRRGFSWFSIQAGLVAPIFLLELALTNPTYRQNLATFALLYIAGGGIGLVISLPYAVKYGYWRASCRPRPGSPSRSCAGWPPWRRPSRCRPGPSRRGCRSGRRPPSRSQCRPAGPAGWQQHPGQP